MKTSKFSPLALAFSLLASQASAQVPCETITQDFQWNVFTITQRADTVNKKFCLSFKSDNENIKEVLIKISDDTSPITTIGAEGCLDLKGAATQGLTPMVIQTNGKVVNLMTLRIGQAAQVYNAMVKECAVHPSSYQPINFKTLKPL